MKHIILALALFCPAAALAQGTTPAPADADKPAATSQPMVGDKPLVQVGKKSAAKKG